MPTGRATEWEPESERWIEWTRTPGFDAYWTYRAAFFDDVLCPAGQRTLEVGCGEGRVARDLSIRGHRVVAIEPARSLLAAANAAGSSGQQYAIADGTALPFVDAAFDVVVAYNVLQVVDDLDLALNEAARVLVPGGHLCACVAHPVTDLGDVSEDPGYPRLTIREHYFEPRRVDDTVEVDGHAMTFRGWTHSLEDYSLALERAAPRPRRVGVQPMESRAALPELPGCQPGTHIAGWTSRIRRNPAAGFRVGGESRPVVWVFRPVGTTRSSEGVVSDRTVVL